MKYMMLFLLLLISCSTEKKTNIIYVEVSPEKITLEQKTVKKENLEKELKSIIANKKTQGFKSEELIIDLKVDERAKRGALADIETTLRRLNLRKVSYSKFSMEQKSSVF
jgi:biopolymer transport protein ExbD